MTVHTQGEAPDWVSLEFEDGQLNILKSCHCVVHLESCGRDSYSLRLSKLDDSFIVDISSNGYIKAKIIDKSGPISV